MKTSKYSVADVFQVMRDGYWRTLDELAAILQAKASNIPAISARVRDQRKKRFGHHTVEKRRRRHNTYEYRLIPANQAA